MGIKDCRPNPDYFVNGNGECFESYSNHVAMIQERTAIESGILRYLPTSVSTLPMLTTGRALGQIQFPRGHRWPALIISRGGCCRRLFARDFHFLRLPINNVFL